tara:strand:+ start:16133 stop:17344 length:1212 start_codon:yes stop_codon:yes gene_type:complete
LNIQKQILSKPNLASYQIDVCESICKVNADHWNVVLKGQNIYLDLNYLNALEKSLPNYDFRYILFFDANNSVVGLCYFQLLHFTDNDINFEALSEKMRGMLPSSFKKWISTRLLICGNAFATGENGFLFSDKISKDDKIFLINNAIKKIVDQESISNRPISISLIKEFWPYNFSMSKEFTFCKYHEVNIDVNMVLNLDSSWHSFDDYLMALNSKFRTKYKQVFKKSKELEIIDFDNNTVEDRLSEIDKLYHNMVNKSSFTFGRLNAKTFKELYNELRDSFYFKGYLIDNKLIGFATATVQNNTLDGNYIGIDDQFNKEYSVYQRILYDFIAFAIDNNLSNVNLGRTAEEIKSGVGALPVEMKFYAKHNNYFKNSILKPFLNLLKPSKFNLRRPFKADQLRKRA